MNELIEGLQQARGEFAKGGLIQKVLREDLLQQRRITPMNKSGLNAGDVKINDSERTINIEVHPVD